MSPLNLPSVIQALFSIPAASLLASAGACGAADVQGGRQPSPSSEQHHHRQLQLKEGLIHGSDEKPFFSPLEERTNIPS